MDFELSEEQRLLKDCVERLCAQRYDFEARKKYMKETDGWSRDTVEAVRRSRPDRAAVRRGARRHRRRAGRDHDRDGGVRPRARAGALFRDRRARRRLRCGAARATPCKATLLPKVAAGETLLAFAHSERQARYDLADVATTAKKDGAGYVLDGAKSLVLHGDVADKLIVSARVSGDQRDQNGIGLFLVDAKANGVSRRGYPTMDGLRAAEVTLVNVKVGADAVIGEPGNAYPLIEQVVDAGIAALCAEAVGAMSAMHEITVDYLKQRKQFGVPIGNFQVLQHRAGEMLIALEQARSMAMLATMMAEEQNAAERRKAISAAKVQIGRSAKFVGQQAIQLHGGIGMTMEYKVGHYFKRVTMIDTMFGDADYHLAALARMGGIVGKRERS